MDPVTLGMAKADAKKRYLPGSPARQNGFMKGQVPITTRLMASQSIQDSGMISNGTDTQKFNRLKVQVTADATDLRLVLGNYYYGLAGPNPITVTAAIETVGPSVSYPVTVNGSRTIAIPADGVVVTDPVPVWVTQGDTLWLRTFVSVAAGQKWPLTGFYWQSGDCVTADGDLTAGTGVTGVASPNLASAYVRSYAPVAVLGTPSVTPKAVFGLFGDSIEVGMNDKFNDVHRGWAERALNGLHPYVNLSRHTEAMAHVVPQPFAGTSGSFMPLAYQHKMRLLSGCTHVLTNYGTNPLGDGTAINQQNWVKFWTDLARRGMKTWQGTIMPRTTSSDRWLTLEGQTTTSGETTRVELNTWLRDGAPLVAGAPVAVGTSGAARCAVHSVSGAVVSPASGPATHPLKGVLDLADSQESARNSGKWKFDTSSVGVVTSGSTAVTGVSDPTWTIGDYIGGPGIAANTSIVGISGTTLTLSAAATATNAAATLIHPFTGDGLHPGKIGHVVASAAVPVTAIVNT